MDLGFRLGQRRPRMSHAKTQGAPRGRRETRVSAERLEDTKGHKEVLAIDPCLQAVGRSNERLSAAAKGLPHPLSLSRRERGMTTAGQGSFADSPSREASENASYEAHGQQCHTRRRGAVASAAGRQWCTCFENWGEYDSNVLGCASVRRRRNYGSDTEICAEEGCAGR